MDFVSSRHYKTVPYARIAAGLSGPLLLGFGSGVSISAGFGPFGFSVLLDGVHQLTQAPLWLTQVIITIVFYLIAWLWGRVPLGIGTLPSLFLIGPAISFGATVTPEGLSFSGDLIAFAIGLVLFAFGIALAAAAALGPDGITAVALAAEKQTGTSIPTANFLLNLSAISLGILLQGSVGPATFFALVVSPVLIRLFLPSLRSRIYVEPSASGRRNSTVITQQARALEQPMQSLNLRKQALPDQPLHKEPMHKESMHKEPVHKEPMH